jgi:hypothetical protein
VVSNKFSFMTFAQQHFSNRRWNVFVEQKSHWATRCPPDALRILVPPECRFS